MAREVLRVLHHRHLEEIVVFVDPHAVIDLIALAADLLGPLMLGNPNPMGQYDEVPRPIIVCFWSQLRIAFLGSSEKQTIAIGLKKRSTDPNVFHRSKRRKICCRVEVRHNPVGLGIDSGFNRGLQAGLRLGVDHDLPRRRGGVGVGFGLGNTCAEAEHEKAGEGDCSGALHYESSLVAKQLAG